MTDKSSQRLAGEIVGGENAAAGAGNCHLAIRREAVGEMSVTAGRTVFDTCQRLELRRLLRIHALTDVEEGLRVIVNAARTMRERQIVDARSRANEACCVDTRICNRLRPAKSALRRWQAQLKLQGTAI